MKVKTSTISLVLAFCMVLAMSVQGKNKGQKADVRIIATGCLQSGATPDTFVLNNATTGMTQTARNQSGNAPKPSEMARSEVSNYVLIPSGKVNLKNFVGKTVRVTGIPSGQSMNTPSSSANENSSAPSNKGQNELKVSVIRTISGTCP